MQDIIKNHIPTGTDVLNELLDGGYEKDIITIIYGPGGFGKTNICLISAIETIKNGKKVIYIDTEGGFSLKRLNQILESNKDYEKNKLTKEFFLEQIFFLKPTTFEDQKKAFEKLQEISKEDIGLIIIDSIAMLYRLEIGKSNDIYSINRDLGRQILLLNQIARKKKIPILITNQVYSSFEDQELNMVGGDLLKYQSKCLIELKKICSGERKAIIRKHRSIAEDKETLFKITQEGITKI
jgi:DNA repair protein RadB